jgi:hypothetical protein
MQLHSQLRVAERFAAAANKWVVYISLPQPDIDHPDLREFHEKLERSIPWFKLFTDDLRCTSGLQCVMEGYAVLECDTEEEAWRYYEDMSSDDNPRPDAFRIYACLISPEIGVVNENT